MLTKYEIQSLDDQLSRPCLTCGAQIGQPCQVTDPQTAKSDKWVEYRALTPHVSR